ncbi:unnamed protein product [Angiostrongylus costaricensis]|uniref:PDZ domain-containing protein n=1 Tax=Angiostrongylus costaricensis TaxID=334426 RepID=A0A0R3PUS5_ANGCS|nr:unnamed protein product [Angiostrongylus costaricensis]
MESKEKAQKLMAERDKLDAEIEDNLNGCTMDSPLVDPEGYPFSHIDIWAVRKARHTIICLRASAECCKDPTIIHRTSNEPFLKVSVTAVETNSPAAKGGLKTGDLIVQYGDLHAGNFKEPKEVALTTNKYEGKKLCVTTLRRGRAVRLEIYPQIWSGSGILGCGVIPMSRANST